MARQDIQERGPLLALNWLLPHGLVFRVPRADDIGRVVDSTRLENHEFSLPMPRACDYVIFDVMIAISARGTKWMHATARPTRCAMKRM